MDNNFLNLKGIKNKGIKSVFIDVENRLLRLEGEIINLNEKIKFLEQMQRDNEEIINKLIKENKVKQKKI